MHEIEKLAVELHLCSFFGSDERFAQFNIPKIKVRSPLDTSAPQPTVAKPTMMIEPRSLLIESICLPANEASINNRRFKYFRTHPNITGTDSETGNVELDSAHHLSGKRPSFGGNCRWGFILRGQSMDRTGLQYARNKSRLLVETECGATPGH